MALQGLTVTLTTTLAAAALAGTTDYSGGIRVMVRNRGAGTVYLGGPTVTSGGYQLTTADAPLSLPLYQGEALYAMSTGGAAAIDVLRMNGTTGA